MKKIYNTTIDGVFIIALLAGCAPTASPAGNGGLSSNAQNYQVEIIDLTEPVYETIRTENIDQPNCNGTGDVDSVVERTMGINHSIELGLGLTVDLDGKLELFGTGVDLGAAISSELGYQYGVTESISRSITVRAAPKTHVVHTVKLSEVWESGTAKVIVNGQSTDIPFRFRANFSIDLLDSIPVDCTTGQVATIPSTIPPTTVPNQPNYSETLCPTTISQSVINSWKIGVADVPTVHTYIDDFDEDRYGGEFTKGTPIPAGVIVAMNFDEIDAGAWSQYPVVAIVHSGSWGVFQSTGDFIAPNTGACRVLIP